MKPFNDSSVPQEMIQVKETKSPIQKDSSFFLFRWIHFSDCRFQFWSAAIIIAFYWLFLFLLVMKNYRLDVIEQFIIGREWVFGSTKHPSLTAILLELFSLLTFRCEIAPYLLARLCVLFSLWAIWQLAREYLSEQFALIAVFTMFCYPFFQYDSSEYNNNITLNLAWSCAVLFVYRAFHTNKMCWWILSGCCLGIGLHFKYTLVLLAFLIVLFLILDPQGRSFWKRKGPWITIMISLALFLPHMIWVYQNDFITLKYASNRIDMPSSGWDHILAPLVFFGSQFCLFGPLILPLVPVCGWIGKPDLSQLGRTFESRYLIWISLSPLLLQIILSAISGGKIHTALGSHLWLTFPILLLHVLKTDNTEKSIRRAKKWALILCVTLATLSMFCAWIGPFVKHRASRYQFPGRALAHEVEKRWHQDHPEKLSLIMGPWWAAGNISVYGKDRAQVYTTAPPDSFFEGPPLFLQDYSSNDIDRIGGVLVWFIPQGSPNDYIPSNLFERFPSVIVQEPVILPYQTAADLPPLRVGMGMIDQRDP